MFAQGTKGIDSASPNLDNVAAFNTGSRFHIRYSAAAATDVNNPSHPRNAAKLVQPGEIAKILASGQDFKANDEWYEDRITEGASAAEQDAPITLAFWRVQGLNPGSSISLNLDTGYDASKLNAIEAYYDRTNQIWGGEYLADDFYGPLACMRPLAQSGRIKHLWIPEGASFFGPNSPLTNPPPPARKAWDLWAPTPSQVQYAINWLLEQIGDDLKYLESVVWQDLNHWFNGGADENIVLKGDKLGTHLEAAGSQPTPPSPPTPPAPPAPTPGPKLWQNYPVPSLIRQGSKQYLGSISGPAASHGGIDANEKGIIRVLQQRLIACGFVTGVTDPNSGWADGVFDTPADRPGTGATSQAVKRFHDAWYPNQPQPTQIWADDWAKLFTHA